MSMMYRELRRQDKKTDPCEAMRMLNEGEYGVLCTTSADGSPYGVFLSYVLMEDAVYFHCAPEGHKMDNMQCHPHVCFTVLKDYERIPGKTNIHYSSITLFGQMSVIHGAERHRALIALINKYTAPGPSAHAILEREDDGRSVVVKIKIEHITGKKS
jgi:uncharacterized protein